MDPFASWGGSSDYYAADIPVVVTAESPALNPECRQCRGGGRRCAACELSSWRGVRPTSGPYGLAHAPRDSNAVDHFRRGRPHDRDYANSDMGVTLDAVYRAGWDERPAHYNGGWAPGSGELHLAPPAYRGPWPGPAWAPPPMSPYTNLQQCQSCGKKEGFLNGITSSKEDVIIILLLLIIALVSSIVMRGPQATLQGGHMPAIHLQHSQPV